MGDPEIGKPPRRLQHGLEFRNGSPMPMYTAWFTGSSRRKCSAWSRISDALRLRPNRIAPVAQNVQVNGQPDCEERQSERRPSR